MSRRRRPLIVGLLAATAATAFAASPALAGWGPVLQPAASDSASKAALSVNGRGAVGAAWLQQYGRTVTVRSTAILPGRPAAVRTLRRARDRAIVGLTTVLDAHGELTVAWVERASTNGLLHGPITVRAAFRTPAGRWSPVRMVSRASAFAFAEPRLAAAPDGTVALVFNAGIRSAPGMGVAWRTAGRPFGRVGSVPTGRRGYLQEPSLSFDDTGRLYLAGTAGCDASQRSGGVLLTATERRRRFDAERTIAPAPATHLRFVLTGRGRALAAWVGAGCSTTEDLSGPILATNVVGDAVGTPSIVSAPASRELTLSGAPAGSAELSFTQFGPTSPAGAALVARLAPDGTVTPPMAPADGWAAVTADRAGNQLVILARPAGIVPTALAARPASGAAVAPAPLRGPTFFVTAGAPDGSALAAARTGGRALRITVWRPAVGESG